MHKISGRRFDKVADLLRLLEDGPANFTNLVSVATGDERYVSNKDRELAEKQAKYSYHIWCNLWVLPLVKELVPELRKKNKNE